MHHAASPRPARHGALARTGSSASAHPVGQPRHLGCVDVGERLVRRRWGTLARKYHRILHLGADIAVQGVQFLLRDESVREQLTAEACDGIASLPDALFVLGTIRMLENRGFGGKVPMVAVGFGLEEKR